MVGVALSKDRSYFGIKATEQQGFDLHNKESGAMARTDPLGVTRLAMALDPHGPGRGATRMAKERVPIGNPAVTTTIHFYGHSARLDEWIGCHLFGGFGGQARVPVVNGVRRGSLQ